MLIWVYEQRRGNMQIEINGIFVSQSVAVCDLDWDQLFDLYDKIKPDNISYFLLPCTFILFFTIPNPKKVHVFHSGEVSHQKKGSIEWQKLIELMFWSSVRPFKKGSHGFPYGSRMLGGHAGFRWQGTQGTPPPLRSWRLPGWRECSWADTRWQELMWSSVSVTAFISYVLPLIRQQGDGSDTLV